MDKSGQAPRQFLSRSTSSVAAQARGSWSFQFRMSAKESVRRVAAGSPPARAGSANRFRTEIWPLPVRIEPHCENWQSRHAEVGRSQPVTADLLSDLSPRSSSSSSSSARARAYCREVGAARKNALSLLSRERNLQRSPRMMPFLDSEGRLHSRARASAQLLVKSSRSRELLPSSTSALPRSFEWAFESAACESFELESIFLKSSS